jgi:hypothetical protein
MPEMRGFYEPGRKVYLWAEFRSGATAALDLIYASMRIL